MLNRFVDTGGYYVRDKQLAPDEGHNAHRHSTATLTVVFSGQLREEFAHGAYACGAWSLLYKPAGIPHTTRGGLDGVRMLVVGIPEPGLAHRGLARSQEALSVRPGAATALALRTIDSTLRGEPIDGSRATRRMLDLAVARHDLERRHLTAPPWLQKVRELITAPGARLKRQEIARRFGVHPVSVTRAFRRHYGCSPVTYSRFRRVDEAIRRLLSQSTPIASIAHKLGYCDQSHLTRDLNWAAGISPAHLRGLVRRLAVS